MSCLLEPGASPARVVSLVPSTTDSMISLELGRYLVGITDFCPWMDSIGEVARVGGPKNADPAGILALQPQLVLANQEENSRETIAALEEAGIPVWVAFPKGVRQALEDLKELAFLYPSTGASMRVLWLERSVDWLAGSQRTEKLRIFCPIWRKDPLDESTKWMTIGEDTYGADVLNICGGKTVFTGTADCRYPEVSLEEIRSVSPHMVLLPSEPYSFGEAEAVFLRDALRLPKERVRLCDGRDLFWHGTRLGYAIQTLPAWFAEAAASPAAST